MTFADAAPEPTFIWGGLACAGLLCLLFVSAVVLAVVLFRRSRKGKQLG